MLSVVRDNRAVIGAALVFAAFYSAAALLIHYSFHSNGWDLGILHQVVWNTARGEPFEYTFRDISYAGDHWQPALLLLVPVVWLGGGAGTLLVIQGILLAAAAVPLKAAVGALGGDRRLQWAFLASYLFSLGVARAVSFDFHLETAAPLLAFTALWALATRRRFVFAAALIATLTLKEDSVLLVGAMAWLAVVRFGWRREPLVVTGVALAYSAVVLGWLMPRYRGDDLNPLRERYGYLGDSIAEIVLNMAVHPDRVVERLWRGDVAMALVWVVVSAALLPLLSWRYLPALALVVAAPLLSLDGQQGSLQLHYLLVPTTVAIAIGSLVATDPPRFLDRWVSRARLATFMSVGLVISAAAVYLSQSPLPPSRGAELDRFVVDHHASVARDFVGEVPAGAIVSAQSPLVAHLAARPKVYQFPRLLDAEWVVLDKYGQIPVDDERAGFDACLAALSRLGFDLVRDEDGLSLWRKTRQAESVPEVPVWCSGQRP